MTSTVQERILDILNSAVIVDDDFKNIVLPEEKEPEEEVSSGKPPKKSGIVYTREDSTKFGTEPKLDLIKFKKWLDIFKKIGIIPIPVFYDAESSEDKDAISQLLASSDFIIIDFFLKGDINAIDIIKDCIKNKNMIWPIIIFSKAKDEATTALKNDDDFERATNIGKVPCFRLCDDPGVFIQVYDKTEFDLEEARKNLAEYIERNFEKYSLLAMEFYSKQKTYLQAVLEPPGYENLDASLITHAWRNKYKKGDLSKLLLTAFIEKSFWSQGIDPEPMFLGSLLSKIQILISEENDNFARESFLKATRLYNNKFQESLKSYFNNGGKNEEIITFLRNLNSDYMSLEEFFKKLESESYELAKKIKNPNTPGKKFIEHLQALTLHVLLAKKPDRKTFQDLIAAIIRYELLPEKEKDIWEDIKHFDGSIFSVLQNGEILIKHGSKKKAEIDNESYEGDEVMFCITPACDIFRPNKVNDYIKFVIGIDFIEEAAETLRKKTNLNKSICSIHYKDKNNELHLICLNFGNVVSLPISKEEPWKDWKPVLILRPPYAHEILNKYIAYQSLSGVEDIDWESR
ncbi:hypothetical protein BMS3Abin16_00810 [archaeon BMS3Abin16]|nr:hypothetical protein BMS3Abin16_00810 [archaeon BMS3Abin16]